MLEKQGCKHMGLYFSPAEVLPLEFSCLQDLLLWFMLNDEGSLFLEKTWEKEAISRAASEPARLILLMTASST